MLSKTCQYAVRATVYIAIRSADGMKPGLKEVAREIQSPEHFTAKILQTLVRARIIRSSKGPSGGFFVEKEGTDVPLRRILELFRCDHWFQRCILGLDQCSELHPCPVHREFIPFRENLKLMMSSWSIQNLVNEMQSGSFYLGSQDLSRMVIPELKNP